MVGIAKKCVPASLRSLTTAKPAAAGRSTILQTAIRRIRKREAERPSVSRLGVREQSGAGLSFGPPRLFILPLPLCALGVTIFRYCLFC